MREMGLTDEGESVCGVRDGLDRWRERERERDVDGCWLQESASSMCAVCKPVVEMWCPLKCGGGVCAQCVCAVCSVQCAVCSVQCAVCSVQCAVCSVQ